MRLQDLLERASAQVRCVLKEAKALEVAWCKPCRPFDLPINIKALCLYTQYSDGVVLTNITSRFPKPMYSSLISFV